MYPSLHHIVNEVLTHASHNALAMLPQHCTAYKASGYYNSIDAQASE